MQGNSFCENCRHPVRHDLERRQVFSASEKRTGCSRVMHVCGELGDYLLRDDETDEEGLIMSGKVILIPSKYED
ncbi:MAG: hypothetical protein IJT77_11830 [Clostridia bacterium]|nr:hypothetical protein [Clostridia bacterium]